jgi:hypothetical protein
LPQQQTGSSVRSTSSRPVFICLEAWLHSALCAPAKQHPRARERAAQLLPRRRAFLRLSFWRASRVSDVELLIQSARPITPRGRCCAAAAGHSNETSHCVTLDGFQALWTRHTPHGSELLLRRMPFFSHPQCQNKVGA